LFVAEAVLGVIATVGFVISAVGRLRREGQPRNVKFGSSCAAFTDE
jgi:hypothetical protein